jgi:hypothetical protein
MIRRLHPLVIVLPMILGMVGLGSFLAQSLVPFGDPQSTLHDAATPQSLHHEAGAQSSPGDPRWPASRLARTARSMPRIGTITLLLIGAALLVEVILRTRAGDRLSDLPGR